MTNPIEPQLHSLEKIIQNYESKTGNRYWVNEEGVLVERTLLGRFWNRLWTWCWDFQKTVAIEATFKVLAVIERKLPEIDATRVQQEETSSQAIADLKTKVHNLATQAEAFQFAKEASSQTKYATFDKIEATLQQREIEATLQKQEADASQNEQLPLKVQLASFEQLLIDIFGDSEMTTEFFHYFSIHMKAFSQDSKTGTFTLRLQSEETLTIDDMSLQLNGTINGSYNPNTHKLTLVNPDDATTSIVLNRAHLQTWFEKAHEKRASGSRSSNNLSDGSVASRSSLHVEDVRDVPRVSPAQQDAELTPLHIQKEDFKQMLINAFGEGAVTQKLFKLIEGNIESFSHDSQTGDFTLKLKSEMKLNIHGTNLELDKKIKGRCNPATNTLQFEKESIKLSQWSIWTLFRTYVRHVQEISYPKDHSGSTAQGVQLTLVNEADEGTSAMKINEGSLQNWLHENS